MGEELLLFHHFFEVFVVASCLVLAKGLDRFAWSIVV